MYICQCFYTDKNGYTKNSVYKKKIKNKIKFRPTDPLFFAYVTGTTEFFFFGLIENLKQMQFTENLLI